MGVNYIIEPVTSDTTQREGLIRFLSGFENDTEGQDVWRSRLSFWWEENPFYAEGLPRGWVLRTEKEIVGFLGVIITDYIYEGRTYKALNATTWRVFKAHRAQSMSLFLEFYKYKNNYILFDTTPNDTVAKVLQFCEFKVNSRVLNMFFPLKRRSRGNIFDMSIDLLHNAYHLLLPNGECRVVNIEESVKLQEVPDRYREFLVKNKNYEYLRWFCRKNPSRRLIGCFNKNNELSSFAVIERALIKNRDVLRIIDYFIGDDDGKEILSIVNYICSNSHIFTDGDHLRFLILTTFLNNEIIIKKAFFLFSKKGSARLYYTLPDELKESRVLNYISDGDFALF